MGRWQTFDHTADPGLRIHASELPDLFRTAGEALFDIILANRDQVKLVDRVRIDLSADSVENLLIDWLNELIFLSESGHRFFSRFDVTVDPNGRRLNAVVHGEPIELARHVINHEVKAATHHGVQVVHEQGAWTAELILDI
jgi:SHS2 domain-containing protein